MGGVSWLPLPLFRRYMVITPRQLCLLSALRKQKIKTHLRLQNLVFLAQYQIYKKRVSKNYQFVRGDCSPTAQDLTTDVKALAYWGLLEEKSNGRYPCYQASLAGQEFDIPPSYDAKILLDCFLIYFDRPLKYLIKSINEECGYKRYCRGETILHPQFRVKGFKK